MRKFFPLACLLLLGCPYGSPVPLGDASDAKIEPKLLGRWTITGTEPGFSEVEIRAFNETEYYIELRGREPHKATESSRYRAYSSKVGGRNYLNIRELDGKEPRWLIASYDLMNLDTAVLALLSDEPIKKLKSPPASSRALRGYLKDYSDKPGTFEMSMTLKRHRGPGEP